MADCFAKDVDSDNHYDYFLSSFYANRLFNFLDNGSIDAILYPSVKEDLMTTNIAMKHNIFEDNYELFKVEEKSVVIFPSGENDYCELKPEKESNTFEKGQIKW